MRWALHQDPKGGPGASRAACQQLLIVLADHASAAHLVWPSEQTLAERTHHHRRTIRRILRALEAQGLILDTGRRHKRGTIIWLLPVENLGTTGGNMPPQGEGTMSIGGGRVSIKGGHGVQQGGQDALRSSQEPRTEPPKNQGPDSPGGRTPTPAEVPAVIRRAAYGAAKRPPAEPLTADQLEARRREELAKLEAYLAEHPDLAERPDG